MHRNKRDPRFVRSGRDSLRIMTGGKGYYFRVHKIRERKCFFLRLNTDRAAWWCRWSSSPYETRYLFTQEVKKRVRRKKWQIKLQMEKNN